MRERAAPGVRQPGAAREAARFLPLFPVNRNPRLSEKSSSVVPALPRMADVARLAGVSKMTVSRVLAGGGVARATRERVLEVIRKTGYVADAAAGALSSGRSSFVAVLVPSLISSNFSDTVRGLNSVLAPAGLQLLLGDTEYLPRREEALVQSLLRHQPRAVAMTGGRHTAGTRALLERAAVPVVEMWDLPRRPVGGAVGFSNVDAARAMVRYLHAQGYRRIGFIGGATSLDTRGMDRRRGYLRELAALGLHEPRAIAHGHSPITMSHGGPALAALLERWPDTDAVMCVSDLSAFGAIMQCHRRGMKVPQDIAIAGFGNFELAEQCHPAITTVAVDPHGIGQRAGQMLLAALGDACGGYPALAPRSERVSYHVVPRQSA
jgi:LacI family gluconate utilization system Gnt-I transcriptional repressor